MKGWNPHLFTSAFNASLFRTANGEDVRCAVTEGVRARQVFPTAFVDDSRPTFAISATQAQA